MEPIARMTEADNINIRISKPEKKKWQEEAEKRNITLSDFIRLMEQNFTPLPEPVEATILDLSKQLGVSINEVISFCVINTIARTDAEIQALGKPLLNCYLVQRDVEWTEIYRLFKEEYLGNLYAGEAGFSAQNLWAEKQRALLLKSRKNMAKAAQKAKAAREQVEYEKSMQESMEKEQDQK